MRKTFAVFFVDFVEDGTAPAAGAVGLLSIIAGRMDGRGVRVRGGAEAGAVAVAAAAGCGVVVMAASMLSTNANDLSGAESLPALVLAAATTRTILAGRAAAFFFSSAIALKLRG